MIADTKKARHAPFLTFERNLQPSEYLAYHDPFTQNAAQQ
jgi:hypothetical protein